MCCRINLVGCGSFTCDLCWLKLTASPHFLGSTRSWETREAVNDALLAMMWWTDNSTRNWLTSKNHQRERAPTIPQSTTNSNLLLGELQRLRNSQETPGFSRKSRPTIFSGRSRVFPGDFRGFIGNPVQRLWSSQEILGSVPRRNREAEQIKTQQR